jgi:hypothetical protein
VNDSSLSIFCQAKRKRKPGARLEKAQQATILNHKKWYFQFPPTTERTYVPLKVLKRVNS